MVTAVFARMMNAGKRRRVNSAGNTSTQANTKKTVACLLALGCALRAFRPRAYPGLTRRWAAAPANFNRLCQIKGDLHVKDFDHHFILAFAFELLVGSELVVVYDCF